MRKRSHAQGGLIRSNFEKDDTLRAMLSPGAAAVSRAFYDTYSEDTLRQMHEQGVEITVGEPDGTLTEG